MSDLVRVRAGKWKTNVGRAYAEAHDLKILNEPTRKRDGSSVPNERIGQTPKTSAASATEKAAKKTATKSDASPSKEN